MSATAMGIDTEDYRCVGAPDHSQKGINQFDGRGRGASIDGDD